MFFSLSLLLVKKHSWSINATRSKLSSPNEKKVLPGLKLQPNTGTAAQAGAQLRPEEQCYSALPFSTTVLQNVYFAKFLFFLDVQ